MARRSADRPISSTAPSTCTDEPLEFTLPVLPKGMTWHRFADTSLSAPADVAEPGEEIPVVGKKPITVADRTTVIYIGR